MATQNSTTQQEQQIESERSKWGNLLSGFIFILTFLFILGFFWQSIVSFLFIK